ncbi:MAG TPA: hypothetical protein ENF73_06165 [Proteobacteria bacterium]|nr:hypothetical protein [Pseudomonadota bacterium]
MLGRVGAAAVVSLAAVLFCGVCAAADEGSASDAIGARHRISLSLGVHNFWPNNDPHKGTRPNDDGVVTDAEWEYIWDEEYRIQEFDGPTLELGYEYMFERWFGLAVDAGVYGNRKDYNFTVSGFEVESYAEVSVFHIDLAPRFHWTTRWTDLYGGPVLGYYSVRVRYEIDATYGEHFASLDDSERGDGLGWGLALGFEFRFSRHFGIAIEDRLVSAVVDEFEPEGEPAQVGGNTLVLTCALHL